MTLCCTLGAIPLYPSDDPARDLRGAVAAIHEPLIEARIANCPAGHGRGGDALPLRVRLNGLDDALLVHAPIRDKCPANVKGLLSPSLAGAHGVGTHHA